MLQSLIAFAGAAVIIALVPGPSTVMILRQSVREGRRAGVASVLGNEVGVLAWGLAAAFGLSALLVASRIAYDGIRLAGGRGCSSGSGCRRCGRRGVAVESMTCPVVSRCRWARCGSRFGWV